MFGYFKRPMGGRHDSTHRSTLAASVAAGGRARRSARRRRRQSIQKQQGHI